MARTILLADDSPTIRRVVELTFSDSGFRVQSVASGTEALERLERFRPDLVLADVAMPGPSGYEICREVKSWSRPVPVILLAGAFESFDAGRAKACGADDCMVKPFEPRALIERVEALLSLVPDAPGVESRPPDAEDGSAEEPVDSVPESPVVPQPPDPLGASGLSRQALEVIVDAVVHRLADDAVREIARDIVPRVAERIVRERIRELETQGPHGTREDRGGT